MAKKKPDPEPDEDAFDLEFKTNAVSYKIGKQGAARKTPLVMIADAPAQKKLAGAK